MISDATIRELPTHVVMRLAELEPDDLSRLLEELSSDPPQIEADEVVDDV